MSALSVAHMMRPNTLLSVLNKAWRLNRILTAALVFQMLLIPFIVVGMIVDPKELVGVFAWNKPMKFALSGLIYGATFLWLLTFVQGRRRWVQLAASVTGIALIGEQILINMQVIRGVPSHFNTATAFDGAVYTIMGVMIFALSAFNLLLAIWLIIQGLPNRSFAWAIRFGVLASFAAMLVGNLMTGNITEAQQAAFAESGMSTMVGAHSVGVEMGGPGLPFLGWSTVGGDLRVAHFVGLHGMQAMPLFALWLLTPGMCRRLTEKQRVRFTIVAGIVYLAWTGLLTWQAMRGQSIVAMDSQTLLAYVALVTVAGIAGLWIWYSGRQNQSLPERSVDKPVWQ